MPGFSSYDQIITALTGGKSQWLTYNKSSITTVANAVYSLWGAGGQPAAGVFGTALTGRTIDKTTTGAISYNNPTSPATMHAISMGGGSTVALGSLLLYDRLAEYPINGSVTSGTFSTQPALPARDANGATNGEGVLMFAENDITGATSAAVNLTVTYTNSGGTASRSTGAQAIVAGAVGRVLRDQIWVPLQSGDTGVRTIQSYTLSATATSTKISIVLARPLCWLPIMTANAFVERDLVLQMANLPRIYDGTAFGLLLMTNTTTSPVMGHIKIAEN
jgi:hypothetical protein